MTPKERKSLKLSQEVWRKFCEDRERKAYVRGVKEGAEIATKKHGDTGPFPLSELEGYQRGFKDAIEKAVKVAFDHAESCSCYDGCGDSIEKKIRALKPEGEKK